jgi:hypothetical protein
MSALRALILLPLLALASALVGGAGTALAAPPAVPDALASRVPAVRSLEGDSILVFLPGSPPELIVGSATKNGRQSLFPQISRPGLVGGASGPLIASKASRARAAIRMHDGLAPTLTTAKTGHLIAPSAVPPPPHARRHMTGNS